MVRSMPNAPNLTAPVIRALRELSDAPSALLDHDPRVRASLVARRFATQPGAELVITLRGRRALVSACPPIVETVRSRRGEWDQRFPALAAAQRAARDADAPREPRGVRRA